MTELLNTLYVQTQGASLHLDHDSLKVVIPEAPKRTLPLRRLDGIVVYGHVTVSGELLTRCADDGRPVVWMSLSGRFLGRVDGPTRGNVLLRHAQHLAHADPKIRLSIARACVAGKLQNCRQVLLRAARDATTDTQTALRALVEDLEGLLERIPDTADLEELLGWEGHAAQLYFQGLALMLRADPDIPAFTNRNRRPPTDPVNALLSFLYSLTRTLVHGAAEQVGLDPYLGFLHGLRPGKPALALDLMEEFRPIYADRLALNLLNRKQLRAEHFETLPGGAVQLTQEGRHLLLTEWQGWKNKEWLHKLLGRKVPASLLPVVQARLLARHLRGELPTYVPWTVA
ncbi:type I-C CRISPR-associated endonuclease Cas1c [Thermostaphylospora chromogena]|uniref:CRISPR-associated endonuclease Cas1 n=1 Tax=Thermostaphylospora chromogena TaxID=35622 RepID=A0A1H1C9P0_9ACTN|nr:type I-C CRISPR-associated endonuclease Cas1c [Thermostaphylospora chromogena]SDQ60874.1 CRISPR-associated protein, Cas1 family [Thermostaphylospora chromogena]